MVDDITKLSAMAMQLGCVLLPSPPVGTKYIEASISDYSRRSVDGKIESRFQKEQKLFTKFYREVWKQLGKRRVLGPPETYLLTMVFPYCEMNSNYLIDDEKIPLSAQDIAGMIGRDESQVRRIINSLSKKNLIAKVDSGGVVKYVINPEIYWNGGDMVKYSGFKHMFYTNKDKLQKDVKEVKKQLKTMYVNGKKTSIVH